MLVLILFSASYTFIDSSSSGNTQANLAFAPSSETETNYSPIQALINQANAGDTINIPAGHYYGIINVNKTVKLAGVNNEQTIIDGNYAGDVITVNAAYVEISGLTIQNSHPNGTGLWIKNGGYCKITDKIIKNNGRGLWCNNSGYNVVSGNYFESNHPNIPDETDIKAAVYFFDARHFTFSNNTIKGNWGGLTIVLGWDSTVTGNIIDSNSNHVSGFLENGITVTVSNNVTFSNNTVTRSQACGIQFCSCSFCFLLGNLIIKNNATGMMMGDSQNNVFTKNTVQGNIGSQVNIQGFNNTFYHNNIIGSTNSISGTSNNLDNGYPSGGNYWSSYSGSDLNGDGIGDTPFVFDANNTDHYPLMTPYVPSPPSSPTPTPGSAVAPTQTQPTTTTAKPTPTTSPTQSPSTTPTPQPNTIQAWGTDGVSVFLVLGGNITSFQISGATITTSQSEGKTTISFNLTGQSGTTGFSNITIAKKDVAYRTTPQIYIDGAKAENQGYSQDQNNYYVWYTTHFSTQTISIVFSGGVQGEKVDFLWWAVPLIIIFALAIIGFVVAMGKCLKQNPKT